jgi:hypothetical protein
MSILDHQHSVRNSDASATPDFDLSARANPVASSISSGTFSCIVLKGTQGYNYIQQRALKDRAGSFRVVTASFVPNILYAFSMSLAATLKSNRSVTLSEELDDINRECSKANWDGYRARPVLKSLRRKVERFLDALPANIPDPEISADPEGEISLDWIYKKNKMFSICIGNKKIVYAFIDGRRRSRGIEFFKKEIPETITLHLNDFLT